MIHITDAFLAKSIQANPENGDVIGVEVRGLDRIVASSVPVRCEVVLRLEGSGDNIMGMSSRAHRIESHIHDADGKAIALGPVMEFPAGSQLKVNLTLHEIVFPNYGDYELIVRGDNRIVAELPLAVQPTPPNA